MLEVEVGVLRKAEKRFREFEKEMTALREVEMCDVREKLEIEQVLFSATTRNLVKFKTSECENVRNLSSGKT